jgi:hypothetical protein
MVHRPFYSASIRSAWNETLSRPSATLPRKRGREVSIGRIRHCESRLPSPPPLAGEGSVHRKNSPLRKPPAVPSPAWRARGCPVRGGRGFPSIRSAATPISLRWGVDRRPVGRTRHCEGGGLSRRRAPCRYSAPFLISGAARRMVGNPLPAFGHPPPQAGEGRFIAMTTLCRHDHPPITAACRPLPRLAGERAPRQGRERVSFHAERSDAD